MWSVVIAFTIGNFIFAAVTSTTAARAAERSFFQAFAIYWVSRRIAQAESKALGEQSVGSGSIDK
jgi:hypothetical protein